MAFEYLNAFATAFLAIGTMAIGAATWRATERQAEVAEALRDLEFAKAQPKFSVSGSKDVSLFKTGLSDREIALPRSVAVKAIENVREINFVDVPVAISLLGSLGDYRCEIEFTGLYIEDEAGRLILWSEATEALPEFMMMLEAYGFNIFSADAAVRITFVDLLGNSQIRRYRLDGGQSQERSDVVPIYSGILSNGEGFFADEQTPRNACPSEANELVAAIRAAGGRPGPDPSHILRTLRDPRDKPQSN